MVKRAYDMVARERHVRRLAPLVRNEAFRIARRIPAYISVDDLISAGAVGLLHAIDSFDPRRGTLLEVYARQRIRGAILDELRRDDVVPRRMRERMSKMVRAREQLTRDGLDASDEAVANIVGCTPDEVRELQETVVGSGVVPLASFDTFVGQQVGAEEALATHEKHSSVRQALANLSHREQEVMTAYYYEELTYKQIGERLGITESRVCQIHRQAISHLKESLAHSEIAAEMAEPVPKAVAGYA